METPRLMSPTRTFLFLSSLLGALLLAGCDGESLESSDYEHASGPGSALVSWYPPTERTDGSPLQDLAGYKVYYGKDPGSAGFILDVTNPGQTSQFIENLDQGTWYFAVTAYDRQGFESAKSAPASKTIG